MAMVSLLRVYQGQHLSIANIGLHIATPVTGRAGLLLINGPNELLAYSTGTNIYVPFTTYSGNIWHNVYIRQSDDDLRFVRSTFWEWYLIIPVSSMKT